MPLLKQAEEEDKLRSLELLASIQTRLSKELLSIVCNRESLANYNDYLTRLLAAISRRELTP